jgi:cytochrome b
MRSTLRAGLRRIAAAVTTSTNLDRCTHEAVNDSARHVRTPGDFAMSVVSLEAALDAATHDLRSRPRTVEVWDLPVRIFHWSLVLAFSAAFVTGKFGGSEWAQWHGRIGEFILGLFTFRIVWGVIGTPHARFQNFVPTPSRVRAYLKGQWTGHGHNPLGAFSVIVLLLLVGAQLVTGIFANDDISFAGPWADRISNRTSDSLTAWHQDLFYVLASFIALHILAILFYRIVHRSDLVGPMITGKKAVTTYEKAAPAKPLWVRFLFALTLAVTISTLTFHSSSTTRAEATEAPAVTNDW